MNIGRFHWSVLYTDGNRIWQVDPLTGSKHAYEDIDRSRLMAFEMWEGEYRKLFIKFTPSQKLIWRRRVELSSGGEVKEVCHIIGKQEKVNGKNKTALILLFESDGRIEVGTEFIDNHPWLYSPQKVKGEDIDL